MRKTKSSKLNTKTYIVIAIITLLAVSTFAISRYRTAFARNAGGKIADFEINILGEGTQSVNLDVAFDNTTKLYDDEYFNETAVIRNVKVVNDSEVAVKLLTQITDSMSEGLLWYIADYASGNIYDYEVTVQSALISARL